MPAYINKIIAIVIANEIDNMDEVFGSLNFYAYWLLSPLVHHLCIVAFHLLIDSSIPLCLNILYKYFFVPQLNQHIQ
jgi:hypothetical protein